MVASCYHAPVPETNRPSYDLAEIQVKVAAGFYVVTDASGTGAGALGFDRTDIESCIAALDEPDFYKTMASGKRPELMLDVYRPVYEGKELYVKLQLNHVRRAVIVSFKER